MRLSFYISTVIFFSFCSIFTFGQSFAISSIPDSLTRHANAVIREYNSDLEVQSEGKASLRIFKAVTVLNKNGEHFGQFRLYYDKFSIPDDIKIIIYNEQGNQIKKVKQNEIYDHSVYDGETLFSDDRVKEYRPVINQYPYTVTYEYSTYLKGYVNLPVFDPVIDFGISVERSSFNLDTKPGIPIRYHEMNFNNVYTSFSHDDLKYQWKISGYPALVEEPLSVDLDLIAPVVLLSPDKFEYDGSLGDLSSWESYGNWLNELLKDRDRLPEETRMKIHKLTDTIQGNYRKARTIYEYMQSKVRYVSIQLGIGGMQPFSAETVDNLGYGDCKALSNYYMTLLHEAGVPAIYAITKMEEGSCFFLDDFPANLYFNHVVVCLTMPHDSIWVECTNNFLPFGFMEEEVAGHPSLLMTPQGGKVVWVPSGIRDKNRRCRNYNLQINPDGSSQIGLKVTYTGLRLDEGLQQYVMSRKEQEEYLYKYLEINDFVINKYCYVYQKKNPAIICLDAGITCNKYGTLSGNRMFLPVTLGGSLMHVPNKVDDRKLPFELSTSCNDIDSLTLVIPQGSVLESLPSSFRKESKFGLFSISITEANGRITVVKNLKINEGKYAAKEYDTYRDFILSIQKAEKQKILLKMT